MKILIGTNNKGKIQGAKEAFAEFFDDVEIEGINVESNVPDEPIDLDIYNGAKNRVENIIKLGYKADFYIAIESGITNLLGKYVIINSAVVKDANGNESWGFSPAFPVPDKYVDDIKTRDLGRVMDEIFNKNDLRSTIGGISYLTHGKIDRIQLTKEAFIMALTQFINKDTWSDFE